MRVSLVLSAVGSIFSFVSSYFGIKYLAPYTLHYSNSSESFLDNAISVLSNGGPESTILITNTIVVLISMVLSAAIACKLSSLYSDSEELEKTQKAGMVLWILALTLNSLFSLYLLIFAIVLLIIAGVIVYAIISNNNESRSKGGPVYVRPHWRRKPRRR